MLVLIRGLLFVAFIALWVYCVFDVIKTDESKIQNLPKFAWLAIVILVPTIGAAAWLLLGRPQGETFQPGRPQRRPAPKPDQPPPKPPMPDFEARREEALRRYMSEREDELKKREEEIRRLEEEFRKRHDDGTPNN
jgi:hypothetical protein